MEEKENKKNQEAESKEPKPVQPEATVTNKDAATIQGHQTEDENEGKKTVDELKYEQQLSLLKAELEKSKDEAEQWKNKYYGAYADLDNTRKSLQKDHETSVKYRAQGFIEKILPTMDSFQMAFSVQPKDSAVKSYVEGFRMILTQLEQAMKDESVSFIEPKAGDKFDASTMHAIQTVEGDQDDVVSSTFVRGYFLKDRLIRPAMVIVTKKSEKKSEDGKTK